MRKALGLFDSLSAEAGERGNPSITFHGGEPLAAGKGFFREALPLARSVLGDRSRISLQSNLWLLDDEYCSIFRDFGVSVGTSLDGPREINDAQRGRGYFDRTWAGIELLRSQGLETSCIATITASSASRARDIFSFFLSEGLSFDVHPAVRPLGADGGGYPVGAAAFGDFLVELGELYRGTPDRLRIGFFDSCARSVSSGESGLCLFSKCLGDYLAVSPDGGLYSCNRFVGAEEYRLGSVDGVSSMEDLRSSPGWRKIERWFESVDEGCASCSHASLCKGGCPYAALAASPGAAAKDPSCEAYRRAYDWTVDAATEEFFERGDGRGEAGSAKPAGRPGYLISLVSGSPHPYEVRQAAKLILGAYRLGSGDDPARIAAAFAAAGISPSAGRAESALTSLSLALRSPPPNLTNLYLHVTERCNLRCSHCYHGDAEEGPPRDLAAADAVELILQAADLGFEKVSVTGGEPLTHAAFREMASRIASLRKECRLPQLVLRTNLAVDLDGLLIDATLGAFDKIVVSLDGSEAFHDARRGSGSFRKTLDNLRRLASSGATCSLSLSCAVDRSVGGEALEAEKEAVVRVGREIGVEGVTFRPVLPLGRAAGRSPCPGRAGDPSTVAAWVSQGRSPRSSCGLGHSLMVDARGQAFPCHALAERGPGLGDALSSGLREIVDGALYARLRRATVDAGQDCSDCEVRYLCGGICEAWKAEGCARTREALLSLADDAARTLGFSSRDRIAV